MGKKNGSGAGAYVALAVSALFVAGCALAFWLVATGRLKASGRHAEPAATAADPAGTGVPAPKAFSEYSWDELSQIARMISAAADDAAGLEVAREYGIVGADGAIADCVRPIELTDGHVVTCRVVGARADELADGSGKAGLTFMTSPLSRRGMNDEDTNLGGWESSRLRAWLAADSLALLPQELSSGVVEVSKTTNNTGSVKGGDFDVLTSTADKLWAFSASEVYGDVTWFAQEYGDKPIANTGYVDFAPYDRLLCSEGAQYAYFAEQGVRDRASFSALEGAVGSMGGNWWLRTPYPASLVGVEDSCFYQVMASGYPSTVLRASEENGVVAGFCL